MKIVLYIFPILLFLVSPNITWSEYGLGDGSKCGLTLTFCGTYDDADNPDLHLNPGSVPDRIKMRIFDGDSNPADWAIDRAFVSKGNTKTLYCDTASSCKIHVEFQRVRSDTKTYSCGTDVYASAVYSHDDLTREYILNLDTVGCP